MQIVVSVSLDLRLVSMQSTRSIAFMQGEITSEFYLLENGSFLWEVSNLLIGKWIFDKKFRYDFFFF